MIFHDFLKVDYTGILAKNAKIKNWVKKQAKGRVKNIYVKIADYYQYNQAIKQMPETWLESKVTLDIND